MYLEGKMELESYTGPIKVARLENMAASFSAFGAENGFSFFPLKEESCVFKTPGSSSASTKTSVLLEQSFLCFIEG